MATVNGVWQTKQGLYASKGGADVSGKKDKPVFFYDRDQPGYYLTNFYEGAPFYDDGSEWSDGKPREWPTSEHYFQAMKFKNETVRDYVRTQLASPRDVFDFSKLTRNPVATDNSLLMQMAKLGNASFDPQWDEGNDDIAMSHALWYKFTQNPDLKQQLLATGDATLVEDSQFDAKWGIGKDGNGANKLGLMSMALRDDIFKKQLTQKPAKLNLPVLMPASQTISNTPARPAAPTTHNINTYGAVAQNLANAMNNLTPHLSNNPRRPSLKRAASRIYDYFLDLNLDITRQPTITIVNSIDPNYRGAKVVKINFANPQEANEFAQMIGKTKTHGDAVFLSAPQIQAAMAILKNPSPGLTNQASPSIAQNMNSNDYTIGKNTPAALPQLMVGILQNAQAEIKAYGFTNSTEKELFKILDTYTTALQKDETGHMIDSNYEQAMAKISDVQPTSAQQLLKKLIMNINQKMIENINNPNNSRSAFSNTPKPSPFKTA